MKVIAQQFTLEEFNNDLVTSMEQGYNWGSTVGLLLVGSLLAISLISFLFNRN